MPTFISLNVTLFQSVHLTSYTLNPPERQRFDKLTLSGIKRVLKQQLVKPIQAQALSSREVKVEWGSVEDYKEVIDAFVVKYQDLDRCVLWCGVVWCGVVWCGVV